MREHVSVEIIEIVRTTSAVATYIKKFLTFCAVAPHCAYTLLGEMSLYTFTFQACLLVKIVADRFAMSRAEGTEQLFPFARIAQSSDIVTFVLIEGF